MSKKKEKQIIRALESLYTILEYNKVGLLSEKGGMYQDPEGKFCAIGCLLTSRELKLLKYTGSNKRTFRYLSQRSRIASRIGLTTEELHSIQAHFNWTAMPWSFRLRPVYTFLGVYIEKLEDVL